MKLYKVTNHNGGAINGGKGNWPLPNGKPGDWIQAIGTLIPCDNGLHLCREKDLIFWLGPAIWEAEYEGEVVDSVDKIVARKARLLCRCEGWTEQQTARLFSADCAERVLSIAKDKRCDTAVRAARQFAFGLIDDASREAAGASSRAAARAADRAAWATGAATWAADGPAWAAGAAAWAAAGAASSAAGAAAGDAERKWQTNRLMDYLYGRVDLNVIRDSVSQRG